MWFHSLLLIFKQRIIHISICIASTRIYRKIILRRQELQVVYPLVFSMYVSRYHCMQERRKVSEFDLMIRACHEDMIHFLWSSYCSNDRFIMLTSMYLKYTHVRSWIHSKLSKIQIYISKICFCVCSIICGAVDHVR